MSWLTGSFKAFVNKLFKENFDTIFILKKCKNLYKNQLIFYFPIKKFLKIFLKLIILAHPLNFSYFYFL